MDSSEVAVNCFTGVQKMASCAGRGERRGDFLADQSGLADSRDDHASGALIQFVRGAAEFGVEPSAEAFERLGLDLDNLPGVAQLLGRIQQTGGGSGIHAHRRRHP